MVPAEGGPKILKRKSSWHRRHRSKNFGCEPQTLEGEGGGAGGFGGGGGTPPPPAVYGRSNASLHGPLRAPRGMRLCMRLTERGHKPMNLRGLLVPIPTRKGLPAGAPAAPNAAFTAASLGRATQQPMQRSAPGAALHALLTTALSPASQTTVEGVSAPSSSPPELGAGLRRFSVFIRR